MEVFIEKCAGLDVHSETIVACIIKGAREDELVKETETFPTLTKDLFRLLKWLESHDCLLYTSPSPRDGLLSRMPSSA